MGNVQPAAVAVALVVAVIAIEPHTHRAKLEIHTRFHCQQQLLRGRPSAGNPVISLESENAFVFV